MPQPFGLKKSLTFAIPPPASGRTESLRVQPLTESDEREALDFLSAAGSVQAVFMTSMVRDNGLESPFNRGVFYGARHVSTAELVGVALVGHATLVETADTDALRAFAHVARDCTRTHVYLGEEEQLKQFWLHYARGVRRARLVCRELLFELREGHAPLTDEVPGLRPATLDDLPYVMPVQACMAFEECGVNPMEQDPIGFRLRCARRIEQGRVFVWVEEGRLIFKADVLAETRGAVYLEGVYTSPAARHQSYGLRCLARVARTLFARTRSVMLLVNEQNRKGQDFYRRAGFQFEGYYDTIYLQPYTDMKG